MFGLYLHHRGRGRAAELLQQLRWLVGRTVVHRDEIKPWLGVDVCELQPGNMPCAPPGTQGQHTGSCKTAGLVYWVWVPGENAPAAQLINQRQFRFCPRPGTQTLKHQLAGGNSSWWCPEWESRATPVRGREAPSQPARPVLVSLQLQQAFPTGIAAVGPDRLEHPRGALDCAGHAWVGGPVLDLHRPGEDLDLRAARGREVWESAVDNEVILVPPPETVEPGGESSGSSRGMGSRASTNPSTSNATRRRRRAAAC